MKEAISAAFALFALLLLGTPAAEAQDAPWRVVAIDGMVQLQTPDQPPRAAQLNEVVGERVILTTGAKSIARVSNGRQLLVMSANSRLVVPDRKVPGAGNVLQELGSIFFKVDHEDLPHFRVDTPLLAATVKGTSFTVIVGPDAATVAVLEGTVAVKTNDGPAARSVRSGEAVQVKAVAPREVIGPYLQTASPPAPSSSPQMSAAPSGGAAAQGTPGLPSQAKAPAGGSNAAASSQASPDIRPPADQRPIANSGLDLQLAPTGAAAGGGSPAMTPDISHSQGMPIELNYLGYVLAAFFGGIVFFVGARAVKVIREDTAKNKNAPSDQKP